MFNKLKIEDCRLKIFMSDGDTTKLKSIKKGNIEITEISPGIYRATSEKSKYIIEYDRSKCIGAASCAAIAPLTFYMDDENKAMFVEEFPGQELPDFDEDEVILASAQSCP